MTAPATEPESAPTLAGIAGSSARYVAIGELAQRAATLIAVLILARLLTPRDFGVVAIANIVLQAVNAFTALGLGQAMQAVPHSRVVQQTALLLGLITGLIGAVLVAALAGPLAHLLGDSSATEYIRILALFFPLTQVAEVRSSILESSLRFRFTGLAQTAASLGSVGVAIAVAVIDPGPMALILQTLSFVGFRFVILSMTAQGPHQPAWDRNAAKQLWAISRELLPAGIFVVVYQNFDNATVSRALGATALGAYSLAFTLTNAPVSLILSGLNRLMLPIYRKAAETDVPLDRLYLRVSRVVAWLSSIILINLAVFGPGLLHIAYGNKWHAANTPLRILCGYGLARTAAGINGPLFLVTGRARLGRQLSQWQLIGMAVIIIPATIEWHLPGTALAVTVPLIISNLISIRCASGLIERRFTTVMSRLLAPMIGITVCTFAAAGLADLVAAGSAATGIGLLLSGVADAGLLAIWLRPELEQLVRSRVVAV